MLINANDDLLVGKYKNNRENIRTIKRILTRSKRKPFYMQRPYSGKFKYCFNISKIFNEIAVCMEDFC